jgi:hypothetical protein
MMAYLALIRLQDGTLGLQGCGDRNRHTNFWLFTVDGEGGDPFLFGNAQWELVDCVPAVEYDPGDSDSFWAAQQEIVSAARAAGIELPEYVD